MRKPVLSGVFACAIFLAANNSTASAQALDVLSIGVSNKNTANMLAVAEPKKVVQLPEQAPEVVPPKPEPVPVVYEVKEGDSLSVIATQHNTTWKRLFDKNTQIAHPDLINAGDKIIVPLAEEQLIERALPLPPERAPAPAAATKVSSANYAPTPQSSRGASAGNTYTAGYCTWYAKNMRPDLPNNLGNADTWVMRAAAQGLATGSTPRAGAIGQQGMHVVYVQSVNANGTVNISEMNYQGLYVVSTRTVPAGSFTYIY